MSDISLAALRLAKTQNNFSPGPKKQKLRQAPNQNRSLKPLSKYKKEASILFSQTPPYVPTRLTDELLLDGRSEPRLALDGGKDGLNLFARLQKMQKLP